MTRHTLDSFRSVHSNALEKNKSLYTLLQHGVETTVDRSQKNSRIISWIENGWASDCPIEQNEKSGSVTSSEAANNEVIDIRASSDPDDVNEDDNFSSA